MLLDTVRSLSASCAEMRTGADEPCPPGTRRLLKSCPESRGKGCGGSRGRPAALLPPFSSPHGTSPERPPAHSQAHGRGSLLGSAARSRSGNRRATSLLPGRRSTSLGLQCGKVGPSPLPGTQAVQKGELRAVRTSERPGTGVKEFESDQPPRGPSTLPGTPPRLSSGVLLEMLSGLEPRPFWGHNARGPSPNVWSCGGGGPGLPEKTETQVRFGGPPRSSSQRPPRF